jgi:iron complex outermembrane recepter protein
LNKTYRRAIGLACIAAFLGAVAAPGVLRAEEPAESATGITIPGGDLDAALKALMRQTGVQLMYDRKTVEGISTKGVKEAKSAEEAIRKLLEGTSLSSRTDASGAILIAGPQTAAAPDAGAADGASVAQSPDSKIALEEVLVTAQKRVERLQDVPLSVAVISSQDIARRGLIGMGDYLRSMPGVNHVDRGGRDNAIVIRGVSTQLDFEYFGSGPTVGSYFDETPVTGAAGNTGNMDIRPVDFERIEVLRGPQGTAYGSGSLGGTLRMIPAKPELDAFSARFAGSFSDTSGTGGDNSMVQGVVNIPLVTDALALRAVAYRFDESGFYRNRGGVDPTAVAFAERFGVGDYVRGYAQDDVGHIVSTGGRLAALWRATDALDVSVNVLQQNIEQDGYPIANFNEYEQTFFPVLPQQRLRGVSGDASDSELTLANLVLSYDLRWATLTAVGSWVDGSADVVTAPVVLAFVPISASNPSSTESRSGEMRLASKLEGRLQFLAGLYYEDVEFQESTLSLWPGTAANSPSGNLDPLIVTFNARNTDQRAVFGEISYEVTPQLTATVGGRYFDYERSEDALSEGFYFDAPIGTTALQRLENNEDGTSLKANLSYKPTDDSLIYASWAEGFRLGRPQTGVLPSACDINNDGIVDGTGVTLAETRQIDSDYLDNYELGAKFSLLDRRMIVDASVYRIDWQGLPVITDPGCGFRSYVANAGAATSQGVELQVSLFVREGLKVDVGGGYTKAELSRDSPGIGNEGDRLPGSPRVSANLAAQYDFKLAGRNAFVRADSFYTGRLYQSVGEAGFPAGDYVKVDARAGVTLDNLSVELFVRNLTNDDAFTWRALGVTPTSTPMAGFQLRPRTIGIQLGYSFRP